MNLTCFQQTCLFVQGSRQLKKASKPAYLAVKEYHDNGFVAPEKQASVECKRVLEDYLTLHYRGSVPGLEVEMGNSIYSARKEQPTKSKKDDKPYWMQLQERYHY